MSKGYLPLLIVLLGTLSLSCFTTAAIIKRNVKKNTKHSKIVQEKHNQ